jgi:hypothetical protein
MADEMDAQLIPHFPGAPADVERSLDCALSANVLMCCSLDGRMSKARHLLDLALTASNPHVYSILPDLGSLTQADASLIDAGRLFEQPGPPPEPMVIVETGK